MPYRLHEKGHFGLGSAPPFSPEFNNYIGQIECKRPDCHECRKQREAKADERWRNPEPRLRATRAFRKVRKMAPREFDALYLYCINKFTITEIAQALSERAARLGHKDRYDSVAVFLLLLSGIDKVIKVW